MPQETKFTVALLLVVAVCFGVVVWQKMEHHKKLLAGQEQSPPGNPFDGAPPPAQTASNSAENGNPSRDNPFFNSAASGSPSTSAAGNKPAPPEPRRLNPEANFGVRPPGAPSQNPFDDASRSPAQTAQNPPTQGLFEEPRPSGQQTASGFAPTQNPFDGAPESPRPPSSNPFNEAGQANARPVENRPPQQTGGGSFNPFDEATSTSPPRQRERDVTDERRSAQANPFDEKSPAPPRQAESGNNPFDEVTQPPRATPDSREDRRTTEARPTSSRSPFDEQQPQRNPREPVAPPRSPQTNPFDEASANPSRPAPETKSVSSNPFDEQVDMPKRTSQVQPAIESQPKGSFNPFTPAQHTEQESTVPQRSFNPFDEAPVPSPSGGKPNRDRDPPRKDASGESDPKPSKNPNPFDSFPSNDRPPAQPSPQVPAPKDDAYVPPMQPGFPTDPNNRGPRSGDQQPARVYTVKTDESYWTISQKLYGSARYFQALAEHNRHRVGDPKRLRPGMKILVPEANILDRLYANLVPGAQQRGEDGEPLPEGLFFTNNGQPMYRVGKEDTLSDIALKHLGRTSRWVEIHNLNRDKLSTPDRIKPGTVLKMPADASRISYEDNANTIR